MTDTLILQNRIDFLGVIVAERCNPNGDPVDRNVPRCDFDGYGYISDVCLKRKIRDRLYDAGYEIFVSQPWQLPGDVKSLKDQVNKVPEMVKARKEKDEEAFGKAACEKWIDVRSFGQVFAFKGNNFISTPVRGPVSICEAKTLDIVNINQEFITKVINLDDAQNDSGISSDRLGSRFKINHGAYVFRGSIHTQLAEKTGFSDEDAEAIKNAILHMYQGDASINRPSGSICLHRLYWWQHNCPNGQYSPIKVFRSVHLKPEAEYPYYSETLEQLPALKPEIIEGW